HRRPLRASAHRLPAIHPLRGPDPRPPRRTHARGPARRLVRREFLPGRRQQGHLGAGGARAMILSRVADGLYWMGRYLERAENTARLLLVTEETSTEVSGLDEELARAEWRDLAEIFPGPALPERATRHVSGLTAAMLQAVAFSHAHPNSVYFSLKRARDNARTVREALTIEVFVNLNETYQDLESQAGRRLNDTPPLRSALRPAPP